MTCQSWTTVEDVLDGCPELDDASVDLEGMISLVSDVLYNLSGRQFPGLCGVEVVRPYQLSNGGCGERDWFVGAGWVTGPPGVPTARYDDVLSLGSCCGQCVSTRLRLPRPIHFVVRVEIDGSELDASAWRSTPRYLDRIDGGRWPCTQDLSRRLTEPNTFGVTYQRGAPLPAGGVFAAKKLVQEYAKYSCGYDCVLPAATTSAIREGIAMTFEETQSLWADGKTGVHEVDHWLRSVNPEGRRRRAGVFRADARGRVARG